MKKLIVSLTATLVCLGAFAQGKLQFVNNINQLIYMTTDTAKMAPGDVGKTIAGFNLAGSSLYTGAGGTIASLAGGPSFTAALFGGATADALTQQAVGTLGDVNYGGLIIPPVNVTFASLAIGTPAFFRIDVFDNRASSAADAWSKGYYAGDTVVFQATPQAVYSPIYSPTAASTMPVGSTFVPLDYVGYAGYYGGIAVAMVPEPGTFALAGLGLASLMIFRRRK